MVKNGAKVLRWGSWLALVIGSWGAAITSAQDLRAPFELETARVLPKGVRNPRFKNIVTGIESRFSGGGIGEPLGQKLNKTVTWADAIAAQPTEAQKAEAQGSIQAAGVDGTVGPGRTTGDVAVAANIKVPVLAWGLTDRWTMAAAFPIYDVNVRATSGFVAADSGRRWLDEIGSTSVDKQNEAAAKMNDAVNQKLARLGYKPVQDQSQTALGDVRLVSKLVLAESGAEDGYLLTLKNDVTLPTGPVPDPANLLATPIGDGQWDIGAALVYDRVFLRDFRWNAFGGYTVQTSGDIARRLPVSGDDSLSADQEVVSQKLGDIVSMGSSLSYQVPRLGITVGAGYQYQRLGATRVEDGKFESQRYRWLEALFPERDLHTGMLMAGFSTVDFYKQKRFALPFQANIAYSAPIAGRQATTNAMWLAELVMFF